MHKFKIVAAKDKQFRVQFVYNSEIIVWSENYKSKASAKNCIESLKKNASAAATVDLSEKQTGAGYRFEIVAGKKEGFFIRFVARNGETMVTSENYAAKKSAVNAIESMKKNGPKAETVDESLQAAAATTTKAKTTKAKTMAAKAPTKPSVKEAAPKPTAKAAPAKTATVKSAAVKPAAAKTAPAKAGAKPAAPKPATKAAAAKPAAAKPASKSAATTAKPAAKAAKPVAKAAKPVAKAK